MTQETAIPGTLRRQTENAEARAIGRPLSRHLSDLCRENALRAADRPAVISRGETFTHAELDEQVDRFAAVLEGLGISRGATVGLWCTNRWEWLCSAFAAMRLGARVAAFPTFAKAWDLDYLLEHSKTEVLVTLSGFRGVDYLATLRELIPELDQPGWSSERYPSLRDIVVIDGGEIPAGAKRLDDLIEDGGSPETQPSHTSANDDAIVVYTSGSSARPKAVPLRHLGIVENGFSIGERMGLTAEDRVWVSTPLFWSYGSSNAMPATLTHAACLVLQEAFEAGEALDLIEQHGATAGYTMPTMTSALLAHPEFSTDRTKSLRTGLTLGSPEEVRQAAEGLPAPQICNIYGSTEVYGNCCVTPAEWPLERRAACQGPPLPGVQFELRDPDTGVPTPVGEEGELYVHGYVSAGYLGVPDDANAVFGADGYYRTGDLGWIDAEGAFRFKARATEMIKTGGINVAPGEVEEFLLLRSDIRHAAVTGVEDPARGQVVVAFVVAEPGATLDPGELRKWCKERIAGYKVPARFHVVDALPKTATGKLARRALAELDSDRHSL